MTVEQGTADITIDARFGDAGEGLDAIRLDQDLGVWRTEQSGKSLAIACAASLQVDGTELSAQSLGPFRWRWAWTSAPSQTVSFQRLIAVARGGDTDSETARVARDALDRARSIGWRAVLEQHEAAWAERWRCSDIAIGGDIAAQRALRFAIYHLNSAANPTDERVSIGARALTGDAYLGHVFWDTEIYVLPFFIATWPEAARSLLMYRWHTLPGARAKAARLGWRGAMYAWESTDTGEETTPEQVLGPDGKPIKVLCGTEEQHITADIAYAVWQYWQATGDDDFMLAAGAEIVLDTSRFWASRAVPEADGMRHIRGVIGPDEYHETIDDSAYTNGLARWNIRRGLEMAALLRDRWPARWAELSKQLDLADAELGQWTDAAERLFIGYDPRTGLFEQFTGFFSLEDLDLSRYAGRTVPLDVVLGRERTQRAQVVKQADVVALLALLPEEIDTRAKRANFRYYEPRCGHGSSLSRGMHALVAARLGETDMALRYFNETAAIDLEDNAGGSAGGVHIAALGGLWQAAVFGFAGVSLQADALALDPRLPTGWRTFDFQVHWRGREVRIAIDQDADRIGVALVNGEPMRVRLRGQPHELQPSETLRLRYRPEA
jgi:trehalose/maltose hydrolase-like predicted phosphorylase